jgi:hypothetical protein
MAQSSMRAWDWNTWAAFTGTQEDAVIGGDVAMLDNEVTSVSVLKVLHNAAVRS